MPLNEKAPGYKKYFALILCVGVFLALSKWLISYFYTNKDITDNLKNLPSGWSYEISSYEGYRVLFLYGPNGEALNLADISESVLTGDAQISIRQIEGVNIYCKDYNDDSQYKSFNATNYMNDEVLFSNKAIRSIISNYSVIKRDVIEMPLSEPSSSDNLEHNCWKSHGL